MGQIGVLVFLAVFFLIAALISRSRRDRLQEEIARRGRAAPTLPRVRDRLAGIWRVSEHTPLSFDRALGLGLFAGAAAVCLVPAASGNISPHTGAAALALGALVFLGVPYLANDVLLGGRVKNFRANIEFGLETLVATLLGTGGDLLAAVREVARVAPGAVAQEFALVYDEAASHRPLKDAFAAMALRVPCTEAGDIAGAAELYETVGGASALTLFRDLAETVRENNYSRSKIEKKFKTMKFYTGLIGVIPLPLLVFLFLQHSWSTLLWRTAQGRWVILLAVLLYAAAFGVLYFVFQLDV